MAYFRTTFFGITALSLLGASVVLGAGPVMQEPVRYEVAGVQMESRWCTVEREGTQPGLLIVPNWMGPREYFYDMGANWAEEGFVVLVVDMYGVDVRPKNPQEAGQAAGGIYAKPDEFRARIRQALELLQTHESVDPERIAAFGFCFGGATVLELARTGADIQGVISFHGALKPVDAEATSEFKAKVVAMHGDTDPYVPDEEEAAFKDELREAGADWTFISFGDTVHSFTNPEANMPGAAQYSPEAAWQAWEMTEEYLEEWCDYEAEEGDMARAVSPVPAVPSHLTVDIPLEGPWFIEGVPVPPLAKDPAEALAKYAVYLRTETGQKAEYTLRANSLVTQNVVVAAMDALKQAGVDEVSLAVSGDAQTSEAVASSVSD
ncbi:MAG: dienelactone hydrolase family protein [Opitutales bacterium]